MKPLAVVALGGNAILRDGEAGTIEEQEQNTRETLQNLIYLLKDGYNLIITHGNGPQVGNILLRNDAGKELYDLSPMPLDVCVADTQGGIGYVIERMLRNILIENDLHRDVLTIASQVLIDENDPAFCNPAKRIGKIYSDKEVRLLVEKKGWQFKPSQKHKDGYRRVVASPTPLDVFNTKTIENIARNGAIVITVGGGGIPVYRDNEGMLRTTDAVIDKDLASSLLASKVKANELYILTDVPYVFLNFGKSEQKVVEFLNLKDAKKYLQEGMFGEGSMAPKIQAAINFLEAGGKKAVITEAKQLENKSFGTKITCDYDPNDREHEHNIV